MNKSLSQNGHRSTRRRRLLLSAMVTALPIAGTGAASVQAADQRPGAVFSMTNSSSENAVTVFSRNADGTLNPSGSFPTGGTGTGTAEDSANGLILANVDGEASPTNTKGAPTYVLALNGGSDSITVFKNSPNGLEIVDQEPSNGKRPISITVNRGVAYVLNGGTPMCGGGSITGFTFSGEGQLAPIPGSTRPLSGGPVSGCTQVAFDRSGQVLIVDEQQADVISTYTRNADGTVEGPFTQQTTGNGPFGLTLTQRNQLLTTENFGAAPAQGSLASYAIDERTGTLTPLGPTVRNGQSDTCWVSITDDNRFAYTSSFGDDGGISSYRVNPDGTLVLLNSQAATVGAGSSDTALSGDSRYLYVKNTLQGSVTSFRIENDGSIVMIDTDRDGGLGGSIGLAAL